MKDRWSALPFALGAAVVLILSFWIPSSPYFGALGIWMAIIGSTLGKGMVFYRVSWGAALPSLVGLVPLAAPWLWCKAPTSRKLRWLLVGGFAVLTGLQFKLLAGSFFQSNFLDPWLLAYLATTVLTGFALVGLGRRLGEGAKTARWLTLASGLCIASLVLLPIGVFLLAFVYLLIGSRPLVVDMRG